MVMETMGVAQEELFLCLDVTPKLTIRMQQLQVNGYNT